MSRIAEAGGPINVRPVSSQSLAKSALSDKKPYPGWIAYIQNKIAMLKRIPL